MTQLLDIRKMRILEAIIDDYILTAAPVGSRTLSKREDIELSPATIRNEMSDLTELGFLEQPHTSAGRVPSEKAYRLYVNNIMDKAKLTEEETAYIREHLNKRVNEVGDVLRETARMISGITNYTSVVLPPQLKNARLKRISLVPVTEGKALAVIVTNSGVARNAMISVSEKLTPMELEKISSLMTERMKGYKLTDAQSTLIPLLKDEIGEQAEVLAQMLENISLAVNDSPVEVVGATNILDYPEYSDVAKAKSFLSLVENGDCMKQILRGEEGVEMTVRIGAENESPQMKDCSVVTVSYRVGNETIGSMGVIGPTRMDYNKVFAVLKCMSENLSNVLSNMLSGGSTDDRNDE